MARFDLNSYDMVETRLRAFLDDYPDGRVVERDEEMISELVMVADRLIGEDENG